MNEPIGRKRWAIAEGYLPGWSNGPEPEMKSHETACILNAGDADASVRITVFFADREPVGPFEVRVGARRTAHAPRSLRRAERPGADPARDAVRQRHRIRRADRGSAYPAGFAAGGERAALDHRLRGRGLMALLPRRS